MVGTGGSAVKTYYLYDGSSLVCELSGQSGTAGSVTASYTWGPNGLLSSHQYAGDGTSYFYQFDPSGNPAQRLTEDGTAVSSAFDGFGAREGAGTSDPAGGFSNGYEWRRTPSRPSNCPDPVSLFSTPRHDPVSYLQEGARCAPFFVS